MSAMTCPKCRGEMHSYERNGVTVDQCADCRGIFLDRGELEHLIAADDRAHAPAPASASAPPQRLEPRESRRESHRESYDSHHSDSHGSYPRKRKKHWTEELFG